MSEVTTETKVSKTRVNVRYLTATAMLSAISFILFFIQIGLPFTPSFLKLDISDLPALIGSFAMGPAYGVLICLIKNLLHLTITSTGGVGELSNFILGAAFVLPGGILYKMKKGVRTGKKSALIGTILGIICMAIVSIPSNYFLVYPVYYQFMPQETILDMYSAVLPFLQGKSMLTCLIAVNAPFTALKGILCGVITMLIYKRISPIIKGISR